LWITCRVLDVGGAVLFENTIVDTPDVDAVVTPYPGLPGTPDPGPPYGFSGSSGAFLYLAQVTDGSQPEVGVEYDSFSYEYRTYAASTGSTLDVTQVRSHTFLPDAAAKTCWLSGSNDGPQTTICESGYRLPPLSANIGDMFEQQLRVAISTERPHQPVYKKRHSRNRTFYCYGADGDWHFAGTHTEENVLGTRSYSGATQTFTPLTPVITDNRFTPTNCIPPGGFPPPPEAIQLSWPTNDTWYTVLTASTVDGPWTMMGYPTIPTNGMNTITIPRPTGEGAQFFKLSDLDP